MSQQRERRSSRRAAGEARSFLGRDNGGKEGLPTEEPGPEPPALTPSPAPREEDSGSVGATVEMLDPKSINWPQGRISSEYDPEKLAELARSLKQGGQEDPIIVRRLPDGKYEGAGGMNRCMAAVESGITSVMCVIREGSHEDVVRANLRTALNQERPTPMSEVDGIAHAHHEVGLSIQEIMDTGGKSEGWVLDRLAISEASPVVKQCLEEGRIAIGHAVLLANIEDLEEQEAMLRQLLTYGWTVKQLEEEIRGGGDVPQDADEGQHDVSFQASNQPSRERKPQACKGCGGENIELQTVPVCEGCLNGMSMGDGKLGALVTLFKETEPILAGSPEGAQLAERIAQLLEGE